MSDSLYYLEGETMSAVDAADRLLEIVESLRAERTELNTLLDELWEMGKNIRTDKEHRDLAQNMRNKIRVYSKGSKK